MEKKSNKKTIFLSASWQYLAMLNYTVPDELLLPYLPKGTQLDKWNGKAMVSIVGFLFNNTKVFGLKWPWHTHFEEINLRFYIKYYDGKIWKRGVAFISEIVPKPVIALTANFLYNEHYSYMPTKHQLIKNDEVIVVNYQWKNKSYWNNLSVTATNKPSVILPNTQEEFIFEHYWGYNQLNNNTLIGYGIAHRRWQVYPVTAHNININITALYGKLFEPYLSIPPFSVYLAEGSDVVVKKPEFIKV